MNTLAVLLGFFGKEVDALRASAAAVDADFAVKQFKAERELSAIRHRNASESLARMLDIHETHSAPALCQDCLDATPGHVSR